MVKKSDDAIQFDQCMNKICVVIILQKNVLVHQIDKMLM